MGNGILKPTNAVRKGCSPVSSECVIWQGEDIPCLKICTGDTISDVMHGLACLVCRVQDQLDVDTYDIDKTCLGIGDCELPHTFREFINLVLAKICELNSQLTPAEVVEVTQEVITVASCFQADGFTQTLSQYVQNIGELVCEQQVTITNHQAAIENLIARVEVLEA